MQELIRDEVKPDGRKSDGKERGIGSLRAAETGARRSIRFDAAGRAAPPNERRRQHNHHFITL